MIHRFKGELQCILVILLPHTFYLASYVLLHPSILWLLPGDPFSASWWPKIFNQLTSVISSCHYILYLEFLYLHNRNCYGQLVLTLREINKGGRYQTLEKLLFSPLRKPLKNLTIDVSNAYLYWIITFSMAFLKTFPKITPSILYSCKTPKLPVAPIDNETQTWSSLSSYNLMVPLDNSKIHDEETLRFCHSLGSIIGGGGTYTVNIGWDGNLDGPKTALS